MRIVTTTDTFQYNTIFYLSLYSELHVYNTLLVNSFSQLFRDTRLIVNTQAFDGSFFISMTNEKLIKLSNAILSAIVTIVTDILLHYAKGLFSKLNVNLALNITKHYCRGRISLIFRRVA